MIGKTTSLCEHCYLAVPGRVFIKDWNLNPSVWLRKTCPEHGATETMIEPDAEFYLGLRRDPSHSEGRAIIDVGVASIDSILQRLALWPKDIDCLVLSGQEPTLRADLAELISRIQEQQSSLGREHQTISIQTDADLLSEVKLVQYLKAAGVVTVMIELAQACSLRQLQGIKNCASMGLGIYYVNYTVSTVENIEEVMDEIQQIGAWIRGSGVYQYHISLTETRNNHRYYLSEVVRAVKNHAESRNWSWEKILGDDSVYHYMVKINGIIHRIVVEYPQADSIDLEALRSGPWHSLGRDRLMVNRLYQRTVEDSGRDLADISVPEQNQYQRTDAVDTRAIRILEQYYLEQIDIDTLVRLVDNLTKYPS